jgi:CheY-like chemotaxis protein
MFSPTSDFQILYADDSDADILLFKTALTKADFAPTLHLVEDGIAALDYLRSFQNHSTAILPAIVLLDLKMPKLSGIEVLAEIKKDPRLKNLRVIIFTNSNRDEDKKKCLELKAYQYVQKPVQFSQLVEFAKFLKALLLEEKPRPA